MIDTVRNTGINVQIDPRGYLVCICVWLAVSKERVSVRSGSVSFSLSQGTEGDSLR